MAQPQAPEAGRSQQNAKREITGTINSIKLRKMTSRQDCGKFVVKKRSSAEFLIFGARVIRAIMSAISIHKLHYCMLVIAFACKGVKA